jgi:hypothetical protein
LASVELGRAALDDLLQALPSLWVERVEELVEVHRGGGLVGVDMAAVIDLGGVVRTRGQRYITARDPRERPHPDAGVGALMERVEVRIELHLDLGLAILGQLDRGHLPDRLAADLDLVAVHELPSGLEGRLDRVLVAPGEHQHPDEHGCSDDAAEGGYSRGSQIRELRVRVIKRLR